MKCCLDLWKCRKLLQVSHVDEKPFLCPDCGRAVKNDKQLKEHMKTVHKIGIDGEKIKNVHTKVPNIIHGWDRFIYILPF